MFDTIITVENLGKKYQLGRQMQGSARYRTLRDTLADGAKNLFRRNGSRQNIEEFWALRDVNVEIRRGEAVGIIGRNGAGKSTFLKVLSRITEPTTGKISIKGRVASLLEVGTGFHPELTGRENIYLNGAILGMARAEIKAKFDEIVAFAEVERFLDTPVKRYSSGMYVRLAFAVAAHLEPEILVVDEVLAVGDADFQKKCLGKMKTVAKELGRTVLFVSHNMAAIKQLCSRALVLQRGIAVFDGEPDQAVSHYLPLQQHLSEWHREKHRSDAPLAIMSVGAVVVGSQPNLKLVIAVTLESTSKHNPAFIAVDVLEASGLSIMQAIPLLEGFISDAQKEHSLEVTIDLPPLIPGNYSVTVWTGPHNTMTLDQAESCITFEVVASPTPGRTFPHSTDHGYIVPAANVTSYSRIST